MNREDRIDTLRTFLACLEWQPDADPDDLVQMRADLEADPDTFIERTAEAILDIQRWVIVALRDRLAGCLAASRDASDLLGVEMNLSTDMRRMAIDQAKIAGEFRGKYWSNVNARTRARQERASDLRARAIAMYEAGSLIKNIAADLGRSERWVYEAIPENLKRRRYFT